MTITLLEYFKIILQKVSFDAKLFEKELKKAIIQLTKTEIIALKNWCFRTFGKLYNDILKGVFSKTISTRKFLKKLRSIKY